MESTIKSNLNRVMLLTFASVSLLTLAFIFCYSEVKQTLSNRSIEETLKRSTLYQIESLLPSFLLEEQKSGIPVLLDKFKEEDELEQVEVLKDKESLPLGFSDCKSQTKLRPCVSDDGTQVAGLFPIEESGHAYGYLFKAKKVPNPFANDHILLLVEASAGVLVISFLLLFLFVSRLTSHELPTELSNLVLWVEKSLSDQSSTSMPKLKFRELNDLGKKISEIIERHNRLQDQAIVGQFTSGIMHDIRTPLHGIVNAMCLAEEQPVGSPKRLSRLEHLLRACCRNIPTIGQIIETTLDVNRDIHISPVNADLRSTVKQSISPFMDWAAQRNIEIKAFLGESSVYVDHDPVQLGRVIGNIVKNAVESFDPVTLRQKAMNGKVRISIDPIRDGIVKIITEDSGPGLPENSESIFRILKSSKPRGSGLGLVISRKIVESHRGRLVASKPNYLSGACFEVVLPVSHSMEGSTV